MKYNFHIPFWVCLFCVCNILKAGEFKGKGRDLTEGTSQTSSSDELTYTEQENTKKSKPPSQLLKRLVGIALFTPKLQNRIAPNLVIFGNLPQIAEAIVHYHKKGNVAKFGFIDNYLDCFGEIFLQDAPGSELEEALRILKPVIYSDTLKKIQGLIAEKEGRVKEEQRLVLERESRSQLASVGKPFYTKKKVLHLKKNNSYIILVSKSISEIDRRFFAEISPRAFFQLGAEKPEKVSQFFSYHNKLMNFVAFTILSASTSERREFYFEFWDLTANRLAKGRNFMAVFSVIAGLSCKPVERLFPGKKPSAGLWANENNDNWKTYRDQTANMHNEIYLPTLVVLRHDLEAMATIELVTKKDKRLVFEEDQFSIYANIKKELDQVHDVSKKYSIQASPELIGLFERIPEIDLDYLYQISYGIEPNKNPSNKDDSPALANIENWTFDDISNWFSKSQDISNWESLGSSILRDEGVYNGKTLVSNLIDWQTREQKRQKRAAPENSCRYLMHEQVCYGLLDKAFIVAKIKIPSPKNPPESGRLRMRKLADLTKQLFGPIDGSLNNGQSHSARIARRRSHEYRTWSEKTGRNNVRQRVLEDSTHEENSTHEQ